MNMDIRLFSHIKDSDYAVSVRFSLVQIEYRKEGAIAVVRFYLHTMNLKDEVRLYQRNIVFNFNRFGEVSAPCKILTDNDEYASIVDKNPEIKAIENELCDSVCLLIGRTVSKHFNKK